MLFIKVCARWTDNIRPPSRRYIYIDICMYEQTHTHLYDTHRENERIYTYNNRGYGWRYRDILPWLCALAQLFPLSRCSRAWPFYARAYICGTRLHKELCQRHRGRHTHTNARQLCALIDRKYLLNFLSCNNWRSQRFVFSQISFIIANACLPVVSHTLLLLLLLFN